MKILHTADLHLGTPFRSLSKHLSGDLESRLRAASSNVLRQIVDLSIRERVDVVSIAGDLFDATETSVAVQYEVWKQFQMLNDVGIRVVLTHGNHDPYVGHRLFPWPKNVSVLVSGVSVPDVDSVLLQIGDRTVQFSGFSYVSRELYGSLVQNFRRQKDVHFAFGLYHGQIGSGTKQHQAYAQASLRELVEHTEFDAWLLGHIHQYSVLHELQPLIVYPGSPIGRDPSEIGQHGVVMIEVDERSTITHRFVPIAEIEWSNVSMDVTDISDFETLRDTLLFTFDATTTPGIVALIDLQLYGQAALDIFLDDTEFLRVAQDIVSECDKYVFIYKITNSCAPRLNVETWRDSDTYLGEVLTVLDKLSLQSEEEELFSSLTQGWSTDDIQLLKEVVTSDTGRRNLLIRQAKQHLYQALQLSDKL